MANLLTKVISSTVWFCLKLAQPEFFRWIHVEGEPTSDRDNYLMVVANHPYGIQDAFLLATVYTRPFCFCATALNFQRREGDVIKPRRFRGWFLSHCKVLPLVRDRREGHLSQNLETFQRAAEEVAGGDALGIFAEGDSRGNQWKLLKLKAGAAQIALQVAEKLHQQGATLSIQVVGLTYTNWLQPFKSGVTLRLAEPFAVEAVDLTDHAAVRTSRRQITEQLTTLMRELTVEVPDEDRELVGKIARVYSADHPNDYLRLVRVAEKVQQLAHQLKDRRDSLETRLDEYLALADELHIYPGDERVQRHKLLLILGILPAYLGTLLHWPILHLPAKLVPKETTELHAIGSDRVFWGTVITLAMYGVLIPLSLSTAIWFLGTRGIAVGLFAVACAAGSGVVASRFFRHVNLFVRSLLPSRRRFRRYKQLGKEFMEELETYRQLGEPTPLPPASQDAHLHGAGE